MYGVEVDLTLAKDGTGTVTNLVATVGGLKTELIGATIVVDTVIPSL
jgi:hypothetical protein